MSRRRCRTENAIVGKPAAVPLLVFMVLFLAVPLGIVLRATFAETSFAGIFSGWTLEGYTRFLSNDFYLSTLVQTVFLSAVTVVLTLIIALPFAYNLLFARRSLMFQLFALFLPMLVNGVVRIFGLQILLRRLEGAVANFVGLQLPLSYSKTSVTLGLVIFFIPLMVVPIYASLNQLDLSTLEAARTLGASASKTFVLVVVPAARAGIVGGAILTFAGAMSSYIVPAMMGGGRVPTLSQLVFNQVNKTGEWGTASIASVVLIALIIPILALIARLGREGAAQ